MLTYRADVDGLRAIAILPVVLYHAGVPGVSGGFVGVDVFFVISGFLITSIVAAEISENRFSLLSFYERRARRILPALTVVVLSTFVLGWFLLLPSEYKNLGQSALAAAVFLSNTYFSNQINYFAPAAEFAPLLHTWSLAVEEQFYLFFPPLLAILFAWRGPKAALWTVLGLSVFSFVAAVAILPDKPHWGFYLIFFRAWELGIGALLALSLMPPPRHLLLRQVIGIIGLLAILVPVFLYDANTSFPGVAALPPVLGAAAIIYVGSNGLGSIVNRILECRSLVWIGLISYSLYLWHWPIFAFLRIARSEIYLPLSVSVVAVAASFLISWACYKYVEQPFRVKPSGGLNRNAIFSLSGAMFFAMIMVGGLLHVHEGIPSRVTSHVAAIAAVSENKAPNTNGCIGSPHQGFHCLLGVRTSNSDPLDFLFFGDSHAAVINPGLDLAAQSEGKLGVFSWLNGCAPSRHVQRAPDPYNCSEYNEAIWSFLKERSDIKTVVLAARWTLYVEEAFYRDETDPPFILEWLGAADVMPIDADAALILEVGLKATIEEFLSTGRKVVILGQIPEVGWDLPVVLARREMLGWFPYPLPMLTEADFEARAAKAEAILTRVAATSDDVRYLRISDLFCATGDCTLIDAEGLPLYVDEDHISLATAKELLPDRLVEIWLSADR